MKKSKKNIYLSVIAAFASILLVIIYINSEYPNGIGMGRIPFDYAWFGLYAATSSVFLVSATMILILSCRNIHELYHSGIIKNMIQRENFIIIKKKILFKTWLSSFFMYPVFLIFTYFICFSIFSTHGVGINLTLDGPMYNSFLILLRACVMTVMYSIIVINVTLIISKKVKIFAVTAILSFISILIYAMISQLIFFNLLKLFFSEQIAKGFDLINGLVFGFGNTISILMHGLILIIITTIILFVIYKNTNEVILNYEDEN